MWKALDGWAREVRVADTYIDAFETAIYGDLACGEMRRLVLPLGPQWTGAIEYCIQEQERVNGRCKRSPRARACRR